MIMSHITPNIIVRIYILRTWLKYVHLARNLTPNWHAFLVTSMISITTTAVMTMMVTISTTIVVIVSMTTVTVHSDTGKGGSKARAGFRHQQKKNNGRPHAIEVVTNRQAVLVAAVVGGSAYGGVEEGAARGGVNWVLSCRPYRCKLGFHLLPPLIQPAFLCIVDTMRGTQASRQLGECKDAGAAGMV